MRANAWTIRFGGLLISAVMHAWLGTLRYRFVADDLTTIPCRMPRPGMYVLWHESLVIPAYTHAHQIVPLVSRSWDGELATQVLSHFGGRAIRGSTNHGRVDRGGSAAAWEIIRTGQTHHVALMVDGPKGPRRTITRPGSIVTAARNHMPIIPVGVGLSRHRLMGPPDRPLAIPIPFSDAWVVLGRAIEVSRRGREACAALVQQALDAVQRRAESLAAGATPPKKILSLQATREL